ncbi:hypothetical protein NP493_317g01017 [Ridgeia piscesae]|uniref:Uncharacterized protein n=1 Tax=Ridgeia piscesae TaxID=27915 RepID=A0AAD9NVZ8_RIDPI|nr:hypothetical protein NP493_317g01017 [Ridgeia piscesae]
MKDTTPCSDTASQAITSQCRVASRHHHTVSPAARNNTIMSVDQHRSRQNCHLFSKLFCSIIPNYFESTHDSPHSQRNNSTHC